MHNLPITYTALDWHQLDKELGSEKLVEAFWTQLSAILPPQGFALGTMTKVGADHNDARGVEMSSPGEGGDQAGWVEFLCEGYVWCVTATVECWSTVHDCCT